MKTVTKLFILIFLGFVSTQAFGQKIGIQGGLNLSKVLDKDDQETYSDQYENNPGFNAGVTLGLGLSKLIEVEVGALVETKGFKISEGSDYYMKANLLYADIPILLKVGPTLGPVKIFGAAGPYFGMGLTGKSTTKVEGQKTSEDIKWGSGDEDDAKRMDYGAKFGIGAEAMKFTFGAYYSLGLANLSTDTDGGTKIQNRVISISVGYKF